MRHASLAILTDVVPGQWEAWMVASQSGDVAAYRRLLHAAVPLLRDAAMRHCADPAAVEPWVQDAIRTIHELRHTYQPPRPVAPWLLWVAELQAMERARRGVGVGGAVRRAVASVWPRLAPR